MTARKAVEAAKEALALRPNMDNALALQAAQRALKEATTLRLHTP